MKARDFELSAKAARSFREIGVYTKERYGRDQMKFYLDNLLARCRALAAGHVPHQSCRTAFADDLREDLRFARVGQHFVIFTETAGAVQIIDFIHQSAEISAKLERK